MNVFDEMLDGWDSTQWTQFTSNKVTQCLGGRLARGLGLNDYELPEAAKSKEWKHLEDIIRQQDRTWSTISIQQWNDLPWRKFDEICEVVKLASLRWDLANQKVLVEA